MSKVLTELGLELGFPACLRHLLSVFGNDDKQATVCNIFSVSHSTSPKKVFFYAYFIDHKLRPER